MSTFLGLRNSALNFLSSQVLPPYEPLSYRKYRVLNSVKTPGFKHEGRTTVEIGYGFII